MFAQNAKKKEADKVKVAQFNEKILLKKNLNQKENNNLKIPFKINR